MITFKEEPKTEKTDTEELVVVDTPATEGDKVATAPDPAIEELRRQLDEARAEAKRRTDEAETERRARAAAEQRASQEATRAHEMAKSTEQTQLDSLNNALGRAQSDSVALVEQKAKLLADGDFVAASKLDIEIGKVAARIENIEAGKIELEKNVKNNADKPREPSEYEKQEEWLNKQASANQTWIRQHRDRFFGDKDFQNKAIAASQEAVSNGLKVGSEDYIRHVETAVGLRVAPAQTAQEPAAVVHSAPGPTATSSSPLSSAAAPRPPAAPPSGGSPRDPKSSGGRVLTITADEKKFCELNDIDPVAYARNREEMRKQGLIGVGH